MLATSRSSRGRVNQTNHLITQLESPAQSPSPSPTKSSTPSSIANSAITAEPPTSAASRIKRTRIASVSDHESIQKRRRTSRETGPPPLAIPLRSRTTSNVKLHTELDRQASDRDKVRPSIISHESQTSISSAQSPLNSPYQRPQYDQFKRIEEKAQKVVRKSLTSSAAKDEKRKLRSEHGSTRSKTELAQYFPAFDKMLSLEPIDPNVFSAATPMVIVNDTPAFEPQPLRQDYFKTKQQPCQCQVVNFSEHLAGSAASKDPLGDDVYLKAHQKAERHEKQMKNGDKERAQHEKYQLERLLEELRGPDWLKTLGISGITDTEKKRYEVKRLLFVREIKALIDKFRRWKEEEKKRKIERQQQLLEDGDADQSEATDSRGKMAPSPNQKALSRRTLSKLKNTSRPSSKATSVRAGEQTHDQHDIDALASQQLLKEAKLADLHRRGPSALTFAPLLPRKPFTSFFEKIHIRDAALSGRIRGRTTYAFGQEVPDFDEQEFELPDYILTDETIKSSRRNRRRRLRASTD